MTSSTGSWYEHPLGPGEDGPWYEHPYDDSPPTGRNTMNDTTPTLAENATPEQWFALPFTYTGVGPGRGSTVASVSPQHPGVMRFDMIPADGSIGPGTDGGDAPSLADALRASLRRGPGTDGGTT